MQLKKRFDRAMEHLRSKRRPGDEMPPDGYPVEKGDRLAMTIAALLVIMPVALLVLLFLAFVGMIWFFI